MRHVVIEVRCPDWVDTDRLQTDARIWVNTYLTGKWNDAVRALIGAILALGVPKGQPITWAELDALLALQFGAKPNPGFLAEAITRMVHSGLAVQLDSQHWALTE